MLSQIKEYKIISLIGKGAHGSVYKVQNINTNEFFAMKMYLITENNQNDIQSIENETKILSKLNHPNIIKLYSYFQFKDSFCLLMELCEHGDLYKLIEQKKQKRQHFNESEIKQYLYEICKGLEYLHSHKIIHRDLKSLNIFLSKTNHIKIGDFGVSKQLINNKKFATTFVGTPYYLSPEICSEKPYDEKSDMWSLGVILYEMINLQKPYESNSQLGLVMKIIKEAPKPIDNDIRNLFSGRLVGLIYSLLEKNPKRRFSIIQVLHSGVFEKQEVKKVHPVEKEEIINVHPVEKEVKIKKKDLVIKTNNNSNVLVNKKKIGVGDITNKRVRTNPKNKQDNKLVSDKI